MDLNVRVIKAVECCPSLYKGQASLEERQVIWKQLADQMRVPEPVLKTRWHLLCGWYQRCLEKRRSTDDTNPDKETGADRNDFRYEDEMSFMMPYIHARITIAAANAARKQQELALAGASDLTEPEFIITQKDIELATSMSHEFSADYTFYEVETLEQQHEDLDENDRNASEIMETSHEEEYHEGDIIEQIDESGNIVVQDIIYEASDQISEDGGEIEIEDELLQMDDQIEVQNEQIIEEVVDDDTHTQDNEGILENSFEHIRANSPQPPHTEYVKLVEVKTEQEDVIRNKTSMGKTATTATLPFDQEYTLATRRRHAVVLKATPRVQVELTDNATANVVLENQQQKFVYEAAEEIATPTSTVDTNLPDAESVHTQTENNNESNNVNSNENNKNHEEKLEREAKIGTELGNTSLNKSTETNPPTSTSSTETGNVDTNTNSNSNERSEDTIFGELVAAMLKQMPPERKRTIKKSIMDLLLT